MDLPLRAGQDVEDLGCHRPPPPLSDEAVTTARNALCWAVVFSSGRRGEADEAGAACASTSSEPPQGKIQSVLIRSTERRRRTYRAQDCGPIRASDGNLRASPAPSRCCEELERTFADAPKDGPVPNIAGKLNDHSGTGLESQRSEPLDQTVKRVLRPDGNRQTMFAPRTPRSAHGKLVERLCGDAVHNTPPVLVMTAGVIALGQDRQLTSFVAQQQRQAARTRERGSA